MTSHPDSVTVELGEVAPNEYPHQIEEALDLVVGARPVLRGEAEERQIADATAHGIADGTSERLNATAMPFPARQTMRVRPAAVAVHDDTDMTGQRAREHGRFGTVRLKLRRGALG